MKSMLARLGSAFLCIVFLLAVQGVVAYINIKSIASIQADAYEQRMHINDIELKLANTRVMVYKILGTMNPVQMDALRQDYQKQKDYLEKALKKEGIESKIIADNFDTYGKIIDLHYDFSVRTARGLIDAESKQLHEQLVSKLKDLSDVVINETEIKVNKAYNASLNFTIGILIIALLVAFLWLFILARSVIDRQQAENILKLSEKKYRTYVDFSPIGIFITDESTAFKDVNPATRMMLGYDHEALLDMTLLSIDASATKDTIKKHVEVLMTTGKLHCEACLVKVDKSILDVAIHAVSLENGNILFFCSDLTQQKKLQAKMYKSQKMESIGNFAGGIAHDFNNILFPIIGMSELILEDLSPFSKSYENAKEILKAGKRGSDLVKQILSFSRKSDHEIAPVRFRDILKEVINLGRSIIPSSIQIETDIDSVEGYLLADPSKLHRISMNLLTNAFHAVEKNNGNIHISLKEQTINSEDSAGFSLLSGRYVIMSVEDTGCGIDPDNLDRIFDPYFTTKDQGKGTGLGLAVVYGIVKEYHGDIKIYSELGKGAKINVYLPLLDKDAKVLEIQEEIRVKEGNERILLVDDEISIARLEKQVLERLGYHVTEKTDSQSALTLFRENPFDFDLVITDMTMPGITGDRLSKEIKSIRPDIPVIICTGFSEKMNIEIASDMGIEGYLMKPVVKDDLGKVIRNALNGKGKLS